ncbi:MAG: GNAT family N-acetyltransferase [Bacteroidota bacterium]
MIRPTKQEDRPKIMNILKSVGVFSAEEIAVAEEVLDAYLEFHEESGYWIYSSVDEHGALKGYICVGPTAITQGTFDLYWIAVDPSWQSRGVGSELLSYAESQIREKGGRLIVIETSSQPTYEPTRRFYTNHGYSGLARIRDYYRIGDDLIIYGKYLKEG